MRRIRHAASCHIRKRGIKCRHVWECRGNQKVQANSWDVASLLDISQWNVDKLFNNPGIATHIELRIRLERLFFKISDWNPIFGVYVTENPQSGQSFILYCFSFCLIFVTPDSYACARARFMLMWGVCLGVADVKYGCVDVFRNMYKAQLSVDSYVAKLFYVLYVKCTRKSLPWQETK